jgi:spore maturation protein CgeB
LRRTTIAKALAEGVDLSVFGADWEGIIPADWVRAANLPNAELPQYYASAGVVINDHWQRMAEDGFVSNRIFDVLACAAPLVTDRVAGMPPEVAAGCTFVEADGNLGDALARATAAAEAEGGAEARRLRAEQIRTLHSFDARVVRLLEILDSLPEGLPAGLNPDGLNPDGLDPA